MTKQSLRVGDSVRVKAGIKDDDLDSDIGGWQGRITKIDERDGFIDLHWDSITLRGMPSEVITQCEEEGLSWTEYVLESKDVEPATARDTKIDIKIAIKEIASAHAWDYIDGPEGELMRKVFTEYGVDAGELYAWDEYLSENLTVPFVAEVSEFQERGSLRTGDKVKVIELFDIDEHYGIIVKLRVGRKVNHFPLCDLEAVDKASPQYLPVHAYSVWFANQ